MLKVLGRRTSSNVQKVLWLLAELGLACEREDYGGAFGGNDAPDYLRLNPNGVVPTLIDGDLVVWESNTILRYLANRHGPTTLYPADPASRTHCERWMDWQLSTLNPVMVPLFVALIRTDPSFRDETALRRHEQRAGSLFTRLDQALTGRPFLAGEEFSLADITLGILTYRWYALPVSRSPKPELERWYASLATRPGFREHVMIGLS